MNQKQIRDVITDTSVHPTVRLARLLQLLDGQTDVRSLQQDLGLSQSHAYRVLAEIPSEPPSQGVKPVMDDAPLAPHMATPEEIASVTQAAPGLDVAIEARPLFGSAGKLRTGLDVGSRQELPEVHQVDPFAELVPLWHEAFAVNHCPYPSNAMARQLFHQVRRYFSREEIRHAFMKAGEYAQYANVGDGGRLMALRNQFKWTIERAPLAPVEPPSQAPRQQAMPSPYATGSNSSRAIPANSPAHNFPQVLDAQGLPHPPEALQGRSLAILDAMKYYGKAWVERWEAEGCDRRERQIRMMRVFESWGIDQDTIDEYRRVNNLPK